MAPLEENEERPPEAQQSDPGNTSLASMPLDGEAESEDREARALLGWVQAVDGASEEGVLTRHVGVLEDLCDGTAFFDILGAVDPSFFRNPHTADTKDNWVLKMGTLKRLYKLVLQYYGEILELSPRALPIPDLESLARETSTKELSSLGRLVIGIAVRSDRANEHIAAIQTLLLEDQQQLMFAIEQTMASLQGLGDKGQEEQAKTDPSESPELKHKKELSDPMPTASEKMYLDLMESHKALQASLYDARAEKEDCVRELAQYKEEVERERSTQADILMRQEIERLKEQLRKSEDNLGEAELEVERLGGLTSELTRKTEDLQRKADEGVKLKDQVEEYKHAYERLQKTENVIEKYKKKLEEGADVKRQLKTVEAQYAELIDRNASVEDEYKKIASFKPLMESYKGQITTLEEKVSEQTKSLSAAQFETEQTLAKLRAAEDSRLREKEEMDLYQERIRELELAGGFTKRGKRVSGDVNGVEGLAANNELASDDDDEDGAMDENLEEALSETTMTGLKIQVRKLMRELRAAQANKADAGRLLVVENLLEDAQKMKARYEKDYLKEYQKGLILEKKIEEILEAKAGIGDGPEANYALRLRLGETVAEADAVKKELSRVKVELEESSRALSVARSDLTLVDKDKMGMLEGLRASVNVEKAEMEKKILELQQDISKRDEQLGMNMSQINALLMDKVDLQNDSIDQRETALQRERDFNSMSNTSEAQTEAKATHEKLAKARAFIRQQDRLLQEARANSTATPQALQAKMKKVEQENDVLRQEQRLMASAWYELQQRLQRELAMTGTFRKNGSNRAQTKAAVTLMGNKPRSWLQQQRLELAGAITLTRR